MARAVARVVVVEVKGGCEGGGDLVMIFCRDGGGGCRHGSTPIDYSSVLIRCYNTAIV